VRIAYVSAGAANMYCGSCLNDNSLVAALQKLGHDAVLIPTYTPLRTDEPDVSSDRVFFGAINVYLKEIFPFLRRRGGGFLGRLLDRPALLAAAARLGSSTDPAQLGGLTLSILRGEEGHQTRELDQLLAWLSGSFAPDVVHLTNSMFAGFARRVKAELGVPVVCSVQGEELFLDGLAEPARSEVKTVLRERAQDIDLFLAPSRWYADFMASYLGVEGERMRVVRLGLNLDGYEAPRPVKVGGPLTLGYLARIAPEKGLDRLAEAFCQVAAELGPGRVRLHAAGYLPPQHRRYLAGVERRIAAAGLAADFRYLGEVTHEEKLRFLREVDVLSVPTVFCEPKGRYVLEALAAGLPVVAPRHGAFPELIEETGGGLLVTPGSTAELAAALVELVRDPRQRERLGRTGREAIVRRYSAEAAARATLAAYEECLGKGRAARGSREEVA
jgi:glycosyltransferase involved in cell wall biosynthesis